MAGWNAGACRHVRFPGGGSMLKSRPMRAQTLCRSFSAHGHQSEGRSWQSIRLLSALDHTRKYMRRNPCPARSWFSFQFGSKSQQAGNLSHKSFSAQGFFPQPLPATIPKATAVGKSGPGWPSPVETPARQVIKGKMPPWPHDLDLESRGCGRDTINFPTYDFCVHTL